MYNKIKFVFLVFFVINGFLFSQELYVAYRFNGTINSENAQFADTVLSGITASILAHTDQHTEGNSSSGSVVAGGFLTYTADGNNIYRIDGFQGVGATTNQDIRFELKPDIGKTLVLSELRLYHAFGPSAPMSAMAKPKGAAKNNYTGYGNLYYSLNKTQSTTPADTFSLQLYDTHGLTTTNFSGVYNSGGGYWSFDLTGFSYTQEGTYGLRFSIFPFHTTTSDTYLEIGASGIEVYGNSALPVELSSFAASTINRNVKLAWRTETEINNYGFEVQRTSPHPPPYQGGGGDLSAGDGWEKIAFVNGHGNSNSPKDYTYIDKGLPNGEYFYRLKQIDFDGAFEHSFIVRTTMDLPNKFELSQNFPNPFNPVTQIRYEIPEDEKVALKVFDINGSEIVTIVNERQNAGRYSVNFNAANLASGIYFYALTAGRYNKVRKLIVLK